MASRSFNPHKLFVVFLLGTTTVYGQSVETDGTDLIVQTATTGDVVLTNNNDQRITLSELTEMKTMLDRALAEIETMKNNISTMAADLETCTTTVDMLVETTTEHSRQLTELDAIKLSIQTNKDLADGINTDLESFKISEEEANEGIIYQLDALSDRVDDLNGTSATKCAPIGDLGENSLIHGSVLTTHHVIGFKLTAGCKTGYAVDGVVDITCYPSGFYCESDGFPTKDCTENVATPQCKQCPKGCTSCHPNDGGCTACDEGLYVLNGACVAVSDCAGYHNGGAVKQGVTKGLNIKLKNGKTTTAAACLVDDDDNVYEAFPCYSLLEPGQRCTATALATQENTCSANGYQLLVFRNEKHYKLMYEAYGNLFGSHVRTTGVHAKKNIAQPDGSRPYTKCAMNSESNSACSRDFFSPDGGDWWLMNQPYSEPNGDLKANWYFYVGNFGPNGINAMNDGRNALSTGVFYFCIPKQK